VPTHPAIAAMPYPRCPAPALARIKQHLPSDHISNPRAETRQRLLEAGLQQKLKPGDRIAITAGSRGMGGFVEILSGIVDAVKAAEGVPFIIPAMGSHGGAVAKGQVEILRRLGVTEGSVGAPIKASMETIELGTTKNGAVAHLDEIASKADGIIVLGRTKTHPESTGPIASGLLKMVTIGLGKQIGAQQAHNHGLWESVEAVPRIVLEKAHALFGVAVVESGFRQPVVIEVVPGNYDAFMEADLRLLDISKQYLSRIPFEMLDLLVIDEVGKNITGSGIELNVVGHWRMKGGPHVPDFRRIVALSLTHESLGNGIGIGLADFTTRRFSDTFDPAVTYVNILTAQEPGGSPREGPMPLALASDKEAIEVALYSSLAEGRPRVCRIKNTAELDEMWVSEALLEEVNQNPKLSVIDLSAPIAFDPAGNLF